ncbi:hypothetical protein ACSZNF_17975 [Aeromonas hydrophila]
MQNDKSLQDKQLIRSIADLIIQDPSRARELFGNFNKVLSIYPELEGVCSLVTDLTSENYIKDLNIEINEINNRVTKNIFISALNHYMTNRKEIYHG